MVNCTIGFRRILIFLIVSITLWLIVFSLVFLFCDTSVAWILHLIKNFQFIEFLLVCSVFCLCCTKYFVTFPITVLINFVERIKRIADWSVNQSSKQKQYVKFESSCFLGLVHFVVNDLFFWYWNDRRIYNIRNVCTVKKRCDFM